METTMTFKQKVSRFGFAYLVCLAITVVLQLAISLLVAFFAPQLTIYPFYTWAVSLLPMYLVGVPVAVLMIKKIPDSQKEAAKQPMHPGKMFRLFLIGYAFTYIGNIISILLASAITVFIQRPLVNPLAATINSSSMLYTFIATVILAPIVEEYLFRHLTYKKLSEYGDKTYILVSAFFFALFHANIFQMIYGFLMGTILAYVYSKTRDIKYSIILHAIINFIGSVVASAATQTPQSTAIFGLCIIIVVIAGIIQFFKNLKNTSYYPAIQSYSEHPVKDTFLNGGMLCFILAIVAMSVFSIISSFFA